MSPHHPPPPGKSKKHLYKKATCYFFSYCGHFCPPEGLSATFSLYGGPFLSLRGAFLGVAPLPTTKIYVGPHRNEPYQFIAFNLLHKNISQQQLRVVQLGYCATSVWIAAQLDMKVGY